MSYKSIIKLITGTSRIVQGTVETINMKGASFVEENILKGNYVTREEFEQLKRQFEKLEAQLSDKRRGTD